MARRSKVVMGDIKRFRSVKGLEKLNRKVAMLPRDLVDEVRPGLIKVGDRFVRDAKRIAPVSEALEDTPGQLRDSIHREDGDHKLSVEVIADAKDQDGKYFAKHAEHGHRTPEGVHVLGVPFWWPTYRVMKKRYRAAMTRALNLAVKKRKAD